MRRTPRSLKNKKKGKNIQRGKNMNKCKNIGNTLSKNKKEIKRFKII